MRRVWLSVMALVFLALVSAGCDRFGAADNEVARFEGGRLTAQDLGAHLEKHGRQREYREHPGRLTRQLAFEHAVNMEMLIAKGLKEKLHLDPQIRDQIHGFMADLFLKVLQDKLVPKIARNDLSDSEVRAYFDAHPALYRSPDAYGLRVIRADDATRLESIREQIEAGDLDFGEAARRYSSDAETKEAGGKIGPRPLARYRPGWRRVIAGLVLDEISEPFRIKDGWYLFCLTEKVEGQRQDFEARKAYVRNDLLYARYQEAWQGAYEKLKAEFDLEVDDVGLKRFLAEGAAGKEAGS